MEVCNNCGVAVNNLPKHLMRGRCKEQHIRKGGAEWKTKQ